MAKRSMTCTYNFKIPSDPVGVIDMVRPMIVAAGGTVTGEIAATKFSVPTALGRFDGVCTVLDAEQVNIVVTEKPDLISCKVIRDQLTRYITQAVVMYRQQEGNNGVSNHG
jgi:hypothetical protein